MLERDLVAQCLTIVLPPAPSVNALYIPKLDRMRDLANDALGQARDE